MPLSDTSVDNSTYPIRQRRHEQCYCGYDLLSLGLFELLSSHLQLHSLVVGTTHYLKRVGSLAQAHYRDVFKLTGDLRLGNLILLCDDP